MSTEHAASLSDSFSTSLRGLDSSDENYVPDLVAAILRDARQHRASDIHLVPTEERLLMQWRIDGVLHSIAAFDSDLSPRIIARPPFRQTTLERL